MPIPGLETIGAFVAKRLAAYGFSKGLDTIFKDRSSFERSLTHIINATIDQFREKYPIAEKDGKIAFYHSQVLLEELLRFRFVAGGGYHLNEKTIISELWKNPNILTPKDAHITNFIELFSRNISQDDHLKRLEEDENFRSQIFVNTAKLDEISSKIDRLDEPRVYPKELTALVTVPKNDIIGRETELADLRRLLLEKRETAVINGMGGIGKTTLAAVYVSEFYDDYDHIVWLTLDGSFEEAVASNVALVENLSLKNVPVAEQLDFCLNELRILESPRPKLLVLDNAQENLASHYDELPKGPGWHLLVTSRERIHRFFHMDLDFLNEDEAIALFKQFNTRFSDEQVRTVINTVERHTLTVEILGKSSERHRWDFDTVKKALQTDAKADVAVTHSIKRVDRIKSYLSTIFDLTHLSEQQIHITKQFTALPNQWISYENLCSFLQVEKLDWKDEFGGALNGLHEKGFLQKDAGEDSFKMHPILVEALVPLLQSDKEEISLLLGKVTTLLAFDQSKENIIDKFPYIPFGDALLKILSRDDSTETATLENNLAIVYRNLGEYEKARDLLESALQSDLDNFGSDHPTVAVRHSNLANVYSDLGEYEKARDLWTGAEKIFIDSLGESHPYTLTVRRFLESSLNR